MTTLTYSQIEAERITVESHLSVWHATTMRTLIEERDRRVRILEGAVRRLDELLGGLPNGNYTEASAVRAIYIAEGNLHAAEWQIGTLVCASADQMPDPDYDNVAMICRYFDIPFCTRD